MNPYLIPRKNGKSTQATDDILDLEIQRLQEEIARFLESLPTNSVSEAFGMLNDATLYPLPHQTHRNVKDRYGSSKFYGNSFKKRKRRKRNG